MWQWRVTVVAVEGNIWGCFTEKTAKYKTTSKT